MLQVTVTFTFDLQNRISIVSLSHYGYLYQILRIQGVLEKSLSQDWDGQADSKLSLKTKPADC